MEFTFNAKGDYKTEFKNYVDLLFSKVTTFTREERLALTEKLTVAYVLTTGKTPAGGQLDRLGSFILHEDLTDKRKNKVTATNYPFLSDWQLVEREKKEADEKFGASYGTDGKKHGKGTRNRKYNTQD